MLTIDQIEEAIKQSLGELAEDELVKISTSRFAPPNKRREILGVTDLPVPKKMKLSEDDIPNEFLFINYDEEEMTETTSGETAESLSDIEDEEVEEFIATPEEAQVNGIIWEKMFSDWEIKKREFFSILLPIIPPYLMGDKNRGTGEG